MMTLWSTAVTGVRVIREVEVGLELPLCVVTCRARTLEKTVVTPSQGNRLRQCVSRVKLVVVSHVVVWR